MSHLFASIHAPRPEWLARAEPEPVLEPDLPIIDTHLHLWDFNGQRYFIEEYARDLAECGHRVDASVFVALATLRRGRRSVAERLVGVAMHAPAHVDVEVTSALARLSRAGTLSGDQAKAALDRFRDAPISRHELPGLVD